MDEEVQKKDGSGDDKSSARKRVRYIDVKVIHREGHATLVEWVDKGEAKRAIVPSKAVEGEPTGRIDAKELAAGQPYGDDFTQAEGVGPELAHELKRIGVWVKADLAGKNRQVKNAIQQVYVGPLFSALHEFAKEE